MSNLKKYKNSILDVKIHLGEKCNEWVNSEPMVEAAQNRGFDPDSFYITGGCFASIFHHLHDNPEYYVKDYDVFFTEDKSSMELMYDLYEEYEEYAVDKETYKTDSNGDSKKEKCLTNNAITLAKPNKFQLICRYDRVFENPVDNIKNFDFQHLIWYYHYYTNTLYISENTFNCILNKTLEINPKAKYFECERYERFEKRGWHPTPSAQQKYLTERG